MNNVVRVILFIALIVIISLSIFFLIPYAIFHNSLGWNYGTTTGGVGDTIGGITGPIVGFIGAILTFLAFWVQVQANKVQTKQFDKQDDDTRVDRFENKFYELLQLHKDNVDEISIDGYEQRKNREKKSFCLYV
jgi:uncharacterized membrane protein